MSELTILESGTFTVTTERFIHGTRAIPMREIRFAWPLIERPWVLSVICVLVGSGLLMWGGVAAKFIGVALLGCSYGVHRILTGRTLVLSMRQEGAPGEIFDVSSGRQLSEVMGAVNYVLELRLKGIANRRDLETDAMKSAF